LKNELNKGIHWSKQAVTLELLHRETSLLCKPLHGVSPHVLCLNWES